MTEGGGEKAAEGGEKYLIFSILGAYYTLPSRTVGEVARFEAAYPLPLLPECLPGVINRYAEPYALLDAGLLLRGEATPRSKVALLKGDAKQIALIIEDVADIVEVPAADMLRVDAAEPDGAAGDLIAGAFRWNGHDVFALNIGRVVEAAARAIEAAA